LREQDDLGQARAEVERFLEGEPDHEQALRIAVECALRGAEPRVALRHVQRLLALDPQDRVSQGQLRALEVGVRGGSRDGVEGGLWALLAADDTFTTVTLGDLCVAQGLLDEATAVFSRILVRNPDHEIARARLAELGRPRIQARRPRG
jgi:uncharacterized protein HemY